MLTRLLNLFLPTFLPLNANNARCSWTIHSMQNNIFIILVEANGCSIAEHQTLWHKLATKNGKSVPKKIRNAEEIWLIFIFLAAAQPLLWYYFDRHIFGLEFFHVFTNCSPDTQCLLLMIQNISLFVMLQCCKHATIVTIPRKFMVPALKPDDFNVFRERKKPCSMRMDAYHRKAPSSCQRDSDQRAWIFAIVSRIRNTQHFV